MVTMGSTSSYHESRHNNPVVGTRSIPTDTFFQGRGNANILDVVLHKHFKHGMWSMILSMYGTKITFTWGIFEWIRALVCINMGSILELIYGTKKN